MSIKLSIELVPKSCFYSNVRTEVSKHMWDKIRKETYRKYNYVCAICGGVGKNHPVECHEIWEYKNGVQRLVCFIALCPNCHEVKHIGLAGIRGRANEAKKHLMKINGWSSKKADEYIEEAFNIWSERSSTDWSLSIDPSYWYPGRVNYSCVKCGKILKLIPILLLIMCTAGCANPLGMSEAWVRRNDKPVKSAIVEMGDNTRRAEG